MTWLRAVVIVLFVGAVIAIAPFWAPLVLAAWFADLLAPIVHGFQRRLGGERRGAAAIVVLVAVVVLAPLTVLAIQIVDVVRHESIAALFLGDGRVAITARDWARLVTRDSGGLWRTALAVAQASTWILLSLLVFVTALYTFAAHGPSHYRWLLRHAPIPHHAFTRFARAFKETGRGILVGVGGTALVQGTVATISYVAIGVPRPWLLGALSAIAALVPAVGTGLVWIPLAIELALTGDYARAAAVTVTGALVISLIDNFVRPVLTRFGKLKLPVLVVLVSMLGGIVAFGPSGALLGPLVVRLAVEALAILRDEPRVTSSANLLRVDSKRSPRSPHRRAL